MWSLIRSNFVYSYECGSFLQSSNDLERKPKSAFCFNFYFAQLKWSIGRPIIYERIAKIIVLFGCTYEYLLETGGLSDFQWNGKKSQNTKHWTEHTRKRFKGKTWSWRQQKKKMKIINNTIHSIKTQLIVPIKNGFIRKGDSKTNFWNTSQFINGVKNKNLSWKKPPAVKFSVKLFRPFFWQSGEKFVVQLIQKVKKKINKGLINIGACAPILRICAQRTNDVVFFAIDH